LLENWFNAFAVLEHEDTQRMFAEEVILISDSEEDEFDQPGTADSFNLISDPPFRNNELRS
jgi:hypothetical protein